MRGRLAGLDRGIGQGEAGQEVAAEHGGGERLGDTAERMQPPEDDREHAAHEPAGQYDPAQVAVRGVVPGAESHRELQRRAEQVRHARTDVQIGQPRISGIGAVGQGDESRPAGDVRGIDRDSSHRERQHHEHEHADDRKHGPIC